MPCHVEKAGVAAVDVSEGQLVDKEICPHRWLEENQGALTDANKFVERQGLWSDGKRLF